MSEKSANDPDPKNRELKAAPDLTIDSFPNESIAVKYLLTSLEATETDPNIPPCRDCPEGMEW